MPSWATGQDAAAPPAIASSTGPDTSPSGGTFVQPKPFAVSPIGSQQSSAVAGGALEDDNESCVVCMSAPVQAGFLHGSRSVPCTSIVASSPSGGAVLWSMSAICRGTTAYKVPTAVVVGVLHVWGCCVYSYVCRYRSESKNVLCYRMLYLHSQMHSMARLK